MAAPVVDGEAIQPVSGRSGAMRLNRWTGEVVWCGLGNAAPGYFDCQADEWVDVPPKQ